METHQTLDARGLNCPLPILRTKKSLGNLASGETLKVIATDPGSLKDIGSFCAQTGHLLLSSQENAGNYEFIIRKR